jgi:outer membrane receptor protein involved in Fe transport
VRLIRELAVILAAPAAFAQVESLDPLTVSATRAPEPRSQVPFTVEVIAGDTFSDGASLTVDDALRSSADFSLFRRNDSMTANPTSQGVSLRGLGPSGASRSLVLLDGVPLNDPFGGWVPWSLLPADSIARVEIVPGGGAAAWGNASLAGVIQLFYAQPQAGSGDAVVRWGDFDTRSAAFTEAVALGSGVLELRGQDFATTGTALIAPESRGPVDTDAASRHDSASARWLGSLGGNVSATVTLRSFDEWRDNGTAYQQNRTHEVLGSVALAGQAAPDVTWSAAAYTQDQSASQTFSSVNAARTAETPASNQFAVPAIAEGFAASSTWSDPGGGTTTAGADVRDIRGETREDFGYSAGAYTEQRFAGGRQTFAGLFAERSQPLGASLHLAAGLRVDRWENSDGHLRNTTLGTGALLLQDIYPTRTGTELSPSAGLIWKASREWELHVAGQRAFREPTLNELYRPFRVGSTSRWPIPTSRPSTPTPARSARPGAGAGSAGRGRGLCGAPRGPGGQRDACPGARDVRGLWRAARRGRRPGKAQPRPRGHRRRAARRRLEAVRRLERRPVRHRGGGHGRLGPGAPALVGLTPAEVPRWNASLGLEWHPSSRVFLSARVRRTGSQYDDDLNRLPLAPATVADASLRIALSGRSEVFLSVDNLGNSQVETAHSATGVFSIAPRGWRARAPGSAGDHAPRPGAIMG